MKKLLILSCLFSAGLFADIWDSRYDKAPSKHDTPLWRAREQFNECIEARGENSRAECQDEYKNLVTCIYREQNQRNDFNQQRNDAARKYNQARQRIETQYCECLQARGRNRKQECLSERDSLIANAMTERDVALANEFDEAQYERNIASLFHEEGYYKKLQEYEDKKTHVLLGFLAISWAVDIAMLYYIFS
jgi:hypothetical protein